MPLANQETSHQDNILRVKVAKRNVVQKKPVVFYISISVKVKNSVIKEGGARQIIQEI